MSSSPAIFSFAKKSCYIIHLSADLFPSFRPENIPISVLQGFFRQFVLTHVYKEIRFHQNLIINAVYIVVGMMMGNQILYPLRNFSGKTKI